MSAEASTPSIPQANLAESVDWALCSIPSDSVLLGENVMKDNKPNSPFADLRSAYQKLLGAGETVCLKQTPLNLVGVDDDGVFYYSAEGPLKEGWLPIRVFQELQTPPKYNRLTLESWQPERHQDNRRHLRADFIGISSTHKGEVPVTLVEKKVGTFFYHRLISSEMSEVTVYLLRERPG